MIPVEPLVKKSDQESRLTRFLAYIAPPERGLVALWLFSAFLVFLAAYFRYVNVQNETFDLAFYARMAWGLSGADFWDPIVGSNVLGLHISPVLFPLGVLGRLFGTVEVLLAAQALISTAAIFPLARIGNDVFGRPGCWVLPSAYLLYPGFFPVVSGEFHPGTLALFPLSCALLSMHLKDARGLAWAAVGVACCREDLLLITGIMAAVLAWRHPPARPIAKRVCLVSVLYVGFFFFVLHPFLAPARGSLGEHFGPWGQSTFGVVLHWITHPHEVIAHVLAPKRLGYLAAVLAPLAFLPLRAGWILLPVLPVFAINLLSHFPAAIRADDHYLSPAIPFLVVAALHGFVEIRDRFRVIAVVVALVCSVVSWVSFERFEDFRESERTELARQVIDAVNEDEQLQAPYELLPHLAERQLLHRAPPPDHGGDVVVLAVGYRERFRGNESLIRTREEPIVRNWLARPGFGPVVANREYIMLRRGSDPRGGPAARYFVAHEAGEGEMLTDCLSVVGATRLPDSQMVRIAFRAHGACPHDLAIRVGYGYRPRRVELLFDGVLSPAWLQEGDQLVSDHGLPDGFTGDILRLGLLRTSGTRPEHRDPVAVSVPLRN